MQNKKYKILQKLVITLWHDENSFKFRLILAFLLILLTSTISLMLPWCLKLIVDKLSVPSSTTLILFLLFYSTIWVTGQCLTALRQIIVYRVFERGVHKLGLEVFEKILTLPLSYHVNKSTGGLLNAIERAQAAFPNVLFGLMFAVIPLLIEIIVALGFLSYYYELKYTLVLLCMFASYFFFTWINIGKVIKAQRQGNIEHKKVSVFIADILMNIEYVHYQAYHQSAINECKQNMVQREEAIIHQYVKMDTVYLGQIAIGGIGFIFLTLLVGLDVGKEKLVISDFVLFNGYLIQFLMPLNALGVSVLRSIREGLTKMEDVMDILVMPTVLQEPKEKGLLFPDSPTLIEFQEISFKYPETERFVLKEISFNLQPGRTIVLVGPNGSGKSTIAKLLYRLYEPCTGQILINNQNINKYNVSSLRKHIGVVPQETLLLNDTLYANLALNENIPSSSPWFQEVMSKVRISDWVKNLPSGYDTSVGERGAKLSGGERQRIALARVLLKNPKIIILDEATSALDQSTEYEIFSELHENFGHITKLIITHNPRNIDFADKVITLQKRRN